MDKKEACETIGCVPCYISALVKKKVIRKTPADYNSDDIRAYVMKRENKRNNYVTEEETK